MLKISQNPLRGFGRSRRKGGGGKGEGVGGRGEGRMTHSRIEDRIQQNTGRQKPRRKEKGRKRNRYNKNFTTVHLFLRTVN